MNNFIFPIKYSIPTPKIKSFITTKEAGDFKKIKDLPRRTLSKDEKKSKIQLSTQEIRGVLRGLKITRGKQIHGPRVQIVRKKDRGREFPSTDGLITNLPCVPLAVFTADCIPIFLCDSKTNLTGIVHAGRKGTKKRILEKAVRKMIKFYDVKCENLLVSFGPHICKNCYPFDLAGENLTQLLKLGVRRKKIKVSKVCTYEAQKFFSYRREGKKTGRMMSVIVRLQPSYHPRCKEL